MRLPSALGLALLAHAAIGLALWHAPRVRPKALAIASRSEVEIDPLGGEPAGASPAVRALAPEPPRAARGRARRVSREAPPPAAMPSAAAPVAKPIAIAPSAAIPSPVAAPRTPAAVSVPPVAASRASSDSGATSGVAPSIAGSARSNTMGASAAGRGGAGGAAVGAGGAGAGSGGGRSALVALALARIRSHRHYPELARRRGIEGTVGIAFRVAQDGSVRDLEVRRSADPALDEAALAAVRDAAPLPPLGAVEVDLDFHLEDR